MRRVVVLTLLALALPIAAWAGGIDIKNRIGTVSITNAGIVSTGSQLLQFGSVTTGTSLGSVSFRTGALISGSVLSGGTFSAAGSSFVVMGVGQWAKTLTGASNCGKGCALFSGSFVGPVTWTLTGQTGQTRFYTLSGTIRGTLFNGRIVSGMTVQSITIANNSQGKLGIGHINLSNTTFTVPEPGTLGLLGTGLVGLGGMFRRKLIGA